MGQLQALLPQLQTLGYQLLVVSGDAPEASLQLTKKLDLSYALLSDHQLMLTRQFGIVFQQGEWLLPAPSVFIVDTQGVIRFQHTNPDYQERLEPDALLAAARASLN